MQAEPVRRTESRSKRLRGLFGIWGRLEHPRGLESHYEVLTFESRSSTSGSPDDEHPEFAIGGAEKRSLPLGELMQHAATHGVHHRGQVALLLRLLGYTPGNFDILFYFRDKHDIRS